jgi:hypothetical protein
MIILRAKVAAFVVAASLGGFLSACSRPLPPRPFDFEAWKSGDERVRGSMVQDLRRSGEWVLWGKSKAEVERLLGRPDPEESSGDEFSYDVLPKECRVNMCRFKVIFNEYTHLVQYWVLTGADHL